MANFKKIGLYGCLVPFAVFFIIFYCVILYAEKNNGKEGEPPQEAKVAEVAEAVVYDAAKKAIVFDGKYSLKHIGSKKVALEGVEAGAYVCIRLHFSEDVFVYNAPLKLETHGEFAGLVYPSTEISKASDEGYPVVSFNYSDDEIDNTLYSTKINIQDKVSRVEDVKTLRTAIELGLKTQQKRVEPCDISLPLDKIILEIGLSSEKRRYEVEPSSMAYRMLLEWIVR